MDESYIAQVMVSNDLFPQITAESLARDMKTLGTGQSDGTRVFQTDTATNYCGALAQPIKLTAPGLFRDHDNGGYYQDGKTCVWQIDQTKPVILSPINVLIEN